MDDVAGRGWPEHFVAYFNSKSGADFPPTVLNREFQPILNPDEIYPGAIVRVSFRIFGWSGAFGTGISLGLGDVQKLADGPRLRGAKSGGGGLMGALPTDDELDALTSAA